MDGLQGLKTTFAEILMVNQQFGATQQISLKDGISATLCHVQQQQLTQACVMTR